MMLGKSGRFKQCMNQQIVSNSSRSKKVVEAKKIVGLMLRRWYDIVIGKVQFASNGMENWNIHMLKQQQLYFGQ